MATGSGDEKWLQKWRAELVTVNDGEELQRKVVKRNRERGTATIKSKREMSKRNFEEE